VVTANGGIESIKSYSIPVILMLIVKLQYLSGLATRVTLTNRLMLMKAKTVQFLKRGKNEFY
jgi:hypothetical protein